MIRQCNKLMMLLLGIALAAQSIAPVAALAEVTMRCGAPGAVRTCGRAETVDSPSTIAAVAGKMHCCCAPAGATLRCHSSSMSTEGAMPHLMSASMPVFGAGSTCTITVRSVDERVRLYTVPTATRHTLDFDSVLPVSPVAWPLAPSAELPRPGTYSPIVVLRDVTRSHGLRAPPLLNSLDSALLTPSS